MKLTVLQALSVVLCSLGIAQFTLAEEVKTAAWYPDPAVVFPEADFLAFLGEGKDAADASRDALDKLARYFGTDIKTISSGSESYTESGTGADSRSSLERSISTKVSSSSQHSLYSVETTPALRLRDDRWAVVARIRRDTGLQAWNQLEQSALDRFNASVATMADGNLGMGVRLVAQKAAAILLVRILDFESKRVLIKADAPALLSADLVARHAAVRDRLLPQLAVRIQSSGDAAADFTGPVASELSGAGFMTGNEGGLTLNVVSLLKEGSGSYGLSTVVWRLDLFLADQKTRIFNLTLQGKASGSDADAARAKALRDAGIALGKQFIPALIDRLGTALD